MRPEPRHARLLDRLAAEYVLGTLRGRARLRFAQWRSESNLVDMRCEFWERHLAVLIAGFRPLAPPAGTLAKIQRRLGLTPPRTMQWAAMLAIASLLVSMLAYWPAARAPHPDRIAVISTPAGAMQWKIEVYAQRSRLIVRSPSLVPKADDRDYELWALPGAGAPAVSLGILPVRGETAIVLNDRQSQALMRSLQMAVSVEPLGGSPTGQPTGPVVFVAPLVG